MLTLPLLKINIEERGKQLDHLIEEQDKSKKTLASNANKLLQAQTLFKSLQYSVKRYFDDGGLSKAILRETASDEAEELLSTTVRLKLNLMDIRELRKRYNQNNKIIQKLLTK
jgi:hypothetical protein